MSIADLKAQANRLGNHLANVHGVQIKHTSLQEALAATHGARDWNTLLATSGALTSCQPSAPAQASCPLEAVTRPAEPLVINGDLADCLAMQQLLLSQQIAAGGSVLCLDDSGSTETGDWMLAEASKHGQALRYAELNLLRPERSVGYSPTADGSVHQVVNKLLGLLPPSNGNPGASFYRETAAYLLCLLLHVLGPAATVGRLAALLSDPAEVERIAQGDDVNAQSLQRLVDEYRSPKTGKFDVAKYRGTYGGMAGRLALLLSSEVGPLLDVADPGIRINRMREHKQLVYVPLSSSRLTEFVVQCLLQDLSAAAVAHAGPMNGPPLLVFVPESRATMLQTHCPEGWRTARFVVVKQRQPERLAA